MSQLLLSFKVDWNGCLVWWCWSTSYSVSIAMLCLHNKHNALTIQFHTKIIHVQLCLESVTLKTHVFRGSPSGPVVKHLPCNAGNEFNTWLGNQWRGDPARRKMKKTHAQLWRSTTNKNKQTKWEAVQWHVWSCKHCWVITGSLSFLSCLALVWNQWVHHWTLLRLSDCAIVTWKQTDDVEINESNCVPIKLHLQTKFWLS